VTSNVGEEGRESALEKMAGTCWGPSALSAKKEEGRAEKAGEGFQKFASRSSRHQKSSSALN